MCSFIKRDMPYVQRAVSKWPVILVLFVAQRATAKLHSRRRVPVAVRVKDAHHFINIFENTMYFICLSRYFNNYNTIQYNIEILRIFIASYRYATHMVDN